MNLRTTIDPTYCSDDYLDVDIFVQDLDKRDEYRSRVWFGLHGCEGGHVVLPNDDDFEYSPDSVSGYEPIERIPDEVRAAFVAAYPKATQEIGNMLAQRNLQPIKPLLPTP